MFKWCDSPSKKLDDKAMEQALVRQQCLTKPLGALGRLEDIAVRLAAMQGCECPTLERIHISVFAADHGIAAEGVSAFPQAVTREMVKNFVAGGAAISVLARQQGATLEVIDTGICGEPLDNAGVIDARVAAGSANFSQQAAMDEDQLQSALAAGQAAVERAVVNDAQLFIAGEMGIANTSSATAVACALLDKPAVELAGPGTGLDDAGVAHKVTVIDAAVKRHTAEFLSPLFVLRSLGGFEIAAIVGAYLAAAQRGLPVLVDGYIASVAALVAKQIQPNAADWWFYAHASAEPGHRAIMKALDGKPLLDLGMRLGEGSGAAVAVPLLQQACILHEQMATFTQAGVSEKS